MLAALVGLGAWWAYGRLLRVGARKRGAVAGQTRLPHHRASVSQSDAGDLGSGSRLAGSAGGGNRLRSLAGTLSPPWRRWKVGGGGGDGSGGGKGAYELLQQRDV